MVGRASESMIELFSIRWPAAFSEPEEAIKHRATHACVTHKSHAERLNNMSDGGIACSKDVDGTVYEMTSPQEFFIYNSRGDG